MFKYLSDYLQYAANNEAPRAFHVWGAYVCLSSAVSRCVWLPWDDHNKYANIYVMYVGGAGNGKTVALDKVRRTLACLKSPEIKTTGNIETPEGFLRWVAGDPRAKPPIASAVARAVMCPNGQRRDIYPVTILANEFVNFIAQNQEGWINTLVDIVDREEYLYRTKDKGTDILYGPYIVMLAALTTEMQQMLHSQHIITTGMARRTFFQYGERDVANPIPIPRYTDEERDAFTRVVAHLTEAQSIAGPFEWSGEAWEWWHKWYPVHIRETVRKPPQVKGWFLSKADMLLKLAMLTAVGDRLERVLRVSDFEFPLSIMEMMEADLMKVFGGAGRNELAMIAQQIFEFISVNGGLVRMNQIHSSFWHQCRPPDDLNHIVDHLINVGKVIRFFMPWPNGTTTLTIATRERAVMIAATDHRLGEIIRPLLAQGATDEAGPSTPPSSPADGGPAPDQEPPAADGASDGS